MRVKSDMDNDDKGKLFVGGLSWETTQENLQRYFSRYGEVIDCVVMKNSESGRSRGFGFVTFSDPANVSLVLQNGPHQLDGRTIDPKPCNPRSLQAPKRSNSYPKVFLGGLPSNITETDLRTYFTRFGKVMEVVIMYDQEKKKSRGFGFLSFEDDDAVDRCVAEHFINLNGKQVEIKKAEPRDSGKMGDGPQGGWGPPQGGPPMGMGGGMGMGGPNGQMGGPMGGPMGPMGPPGNMMQGYQGWGTPPQTGYPGHWGPSPSNQPPVNGYGTPSGPGGYQGWGAPPGPQGQQMPPPQWGSNYGGPPQQQGYGSYGPPQAGPQSGYGGNWNWNMPQNGPPGPGGPPGPSQGPPGPQGDMYSRGSAPGPAGSAPTGPTPPGGTAAGQQKAGSEYGGGYGSYGGYQEDWEGKRKRASSAEHDPLLERAMLSLSKEGDQYDIFGEYVANEMRELSANLRKKAKRQIQLEIMETLEDDEKLTVPVSSTSACPPSKTSEDSSNYGGGRNYAGDGTSQTGGGYSGHPPVPGSPTSRKKSIKSNSPACTNAGQGDAGVAGSSYTGGPGPQRGGNYSQPGQAPGFHPYRRM